MLVTYFNKMDSIVKRDYFVNTDELVNFLVGKDIVILDVATRRD